MEGETDIDEPFTYSKAITIKESVQWSDAMIKEIESLHKNQTWNLVKLPNGMMLLDVHGSLEKMKGILGVDNARYKALLVNGV